MLRGVVLRGKPWISGTTTVGVAGSRTKCESVGEELCAWLYSSELRRSACSLPRILILPAVALRATISSDLTDCASRTVPVEESRRLDLGGARFGVGEDKTGLFPSMTEELEGVHRPGDGLFTYD